MLIRLRMTTATSKGLLNYISIIWVLVLAKVTLWTREKAQSALGRKRLSPSIDLSNQQTTRFGDGHHSSEMETARGRVQIQIVL